VSSSNVADPTIVPFPTVPRFLPPAALRRARAALVTTGVAAFAVIAGSQGLQNAVANGDTRTLSLHHTHTDETITVTFKRNGRYDEAALERLNWFLRDWRRDEPTRMDPKLFDIVWEVYREVDGKDPIRIVSAYRSPATNNMLRSRSRGVAKHSQHTLGRAMDFYIPNVDSAEVRVAGLRLQRGGVGFYPGSNFVHLDTGNVRMWPRMTRDQLARVFPDGRTVHVPADGRPLSGYATALADAQRRGATVSQASFAEARDNMSDDERGVIERRGSTWLARLFGIDTDDDEQKDTPPVRAPRPAAQPVQVAQAPVGPAPFAPPTLAPQPRPAQMVAAAGDIPVPAPRPVEAARVVPPAPVAAPVQVAQVGPTGRDTFSDRFTWSAGAGAISPTGQGTRTANQPQLAAAAPQAPATGPAAPRMVWQPGAQPVAAGAAAGLAAPGAIVGPQSVQVAQAPATAQPGEPIPVPRPRPVQLAAAPELPPFPPVGGAANDTVGSSALGFAPAGAEATQAAALAERARQLAARSATPHAAAAPTVAPQAGLPQQSAARQPQRLDDPWMRSLVLSPSVTNAMLVSSFTPPAAQRDQDMFGKPMRLVANVFTRDPHHGMRSERFAGSAISFVPTITITAN
jgi:uncharacterized protein YcbK (DUF882 family)